MSKRIISLLFALLLLVILLAGCDTSISARRSRKSIEDDWDGVSPRYGGYLQICTAAAPTGLDPLKQVGTWKYQWTTAVYEPFLTRDSQNNIQPCVCDYRLESYQDESGQWYDELWVWPREGYTFSGSYGQVDIDDIVASWNRGLNQYENIKKYVKPNVVFATVEAAAEDEGYDGLVLHIKFRYNEKNLYYFATYRTWWPVMPWEICEKYADSYITNQLNDAAGTGPYQFSDLKERTYVTLTKRDDYIAVDQGDATGQAATKYGYLDGMTFWYNSTDMSAYSHYPILSGLYDCARVIPAEYLQMAEEKGITVTKLASDQRCWIFFNTNGTDNLVAKYPSLRKAILAAIDYPAFLEFVTDKSQILEGDNILLDAQYDLTVKFKCADYYGAYDQALVDKYIAMARAEGYQDEPLQIPFSSGRTDIPTMTAVTMEKAGIPYELIANESSVYAAFVDEPSNNWDFYFDWESTAWTPGTLSDQLVKNNFRSDRMQQILAQMNTLKPDTAEYMALWEEMTDIWVEECQLGYLCAVDWWWCHPDTLHINDGGDDPNQMTESRFFYNTWWVDPTNHTLE